MIIIRSRHRQRLWKQKYCCYNYYYNIYFCSVFKNQNLLRASVTAQENVHDTNQYIITEAKLRAELCTINTKYGETFRQAEEYKHKSTLLQDEIRDLRVKLSRVNHEKVRLERDQRATKLSILSGFETNKVVSLSSSATKLNNVTEMENQKRKIDELNGRIQGMNAVMADKDRQLEELRRQLDRAMTQNHLSQYHNPSTSQSQE